MNLIRLEAQLTAEEGRRNTSYLDNAKPPKWTNGIGHHDATLGPGVYWDDAKVDAVFAADIAEKTAQIAHALPWTSHLDDVRLAVLIEMCFQMGLGSDGSNGKPADGLLAFHHTLGAIRDERWNDAAGGMRDSLWAKETPARANRMARQIETGEWQS